MIAASSAISALVLQLVSVLRAPEAAPPTIAWDAPAACPDADTVARRIAARLPEGIASPPARFVVQQEGTAWRVQATIGDAAVRELQAASCDEATEAAIVLVLVASTRERDPDDAPIDAPGDATPAVEPSPPVEPTPPIVADDIAAPAVPTRAPVADDRPPPRRMRARPSVLLAAGGGVSVAITERTAGLVAGELGVAGRAWSTSLGVSHVITRELDVAQQARARVWLTSLDVRGCGEPGVGRWQFPLCAGASFGAAGGRGIDLEGSRRDRSPWIALRLGVGARVWPIPSVGVFARAEPVFVVGRPQLVVEGLGAACCGANVGFAALLGVLARLGRGGQRNSS